MQGNRPSDVGRRTQQTRLERLLGSPSLVLLLVGILIVLSTIGFAAMYYVEQILVRDSGERLALLATDVAQRLDRVLFERYGDIEFMAKMVGEQVPRGSEAQRQRLEWMKSAYQVYLWLGLTDSTGRMVASTQPASLGRDWSGSDWFRYSRDHQAIAVTDVEPFPELDGGMDVVGFSAPVFTSDRTFRGVVTARVSIHALEDVVERTIRALEDNTAAFRNIEYQILNNRGVAFIDSDLHHKGLVNLYDLKLPSALLSDAGTPGYVEETHLRRGEAVITGYAHTKPLYAFPGMDWSVLVRMSKGDVLEPINTVMTKLAGAGVAVVLPLSALLFWLQRGLHRKWGEAEVEKARARQAEEALQRACQELERRVQERTADKQRLRSLSAQLRRNQERIRQRLATDLHDNIAQTLAFCKLKLQALLDMANPRNYRATVQDVALHLDDALTCTRSLMYDLRPFALGGGSDDFLTAIHWVADKAQRHGLHVIIDDDGKPKAVEEEVLTVLYQSLHETLFNVLKHANTKRARVSLQRRGAFVRVVVRDKGQGFDASAVSLPHKDRCFGLFNMREQLDQVNGRLRIISVRGKGTTIIITVPASTSACRQLTSVN